MQYEVSRVRNKALIALAVALLLMLAAHPAFAAQTAGGGLPFDSWMTKIRSSVTGPYAYAVAIIGLVAAGATLIFGGDMNGFMRTLIFIVLVLAFVVAAQNTLSAVTGQGAEITSGYDMASQSADWIAAQVQLIQTVPPRAA
ncbi:conjugal transfer protein [Escherichia coli]|nr:conjugal transfer protein [Escherichia coli]